MYYLEDLELPKKLTAKVDKPTTELTPKAAPKCGHYLRGPIPWSWLQEAISAGGSAVHTGLAIWHLRALNKAVTFKASLGQLRKWTHLSEKATREGLRRLEDLGLVTVERPAGQSPLITLVEKGRCVGLS